MGARSGGGANGRIGSESFRELTEGEYKRLAETQNVTKEQEKILYDAIAQNKSTKNITVKRRVSDYWLTEGGRTLKQGAVFTEHRFTSTSAIGDKNYFGRRKVHLTIDIPKGKNMFVTKNHAESEIVLPRNTKFKVTKFKSSGGIKEVKLKVM